jgi:cytochrome c-type biogenesis protein
VFVGGLLTSLTPCIYPMIPITAAVIGSQGVTEHGRAVLPARRVAALTMSYVTGLALLYASLGLFAGLSGTLFGGISTNPWSLILMANVLLVFALMMLDVIPVLVPTRWLTRAASRQTGGRLIGAFAAPRPDWSPLRAAHR